MTILPKVVYRFSIIPIEIPASIFAEIDKLTLKFTWKCKRPELDNIILKNKIGGFNFVELSNCKTDNKTMVMKMVCCAQKYAI